MTHDKADWHLEGEFPGDLDRQQAYVPGGLLLAWQWQVTPIFLAVAALNRWKCLTPKQIPGGKKVIRLLKCTISRLWLTKTIFM